MVSKWGMGSFILLKAKYIRMKHNGINSCLSVFSFLFFKKVNIFYYRGAKAMQQKIDRPSYSKCYCTMIWLFWNITEVGKKNKTCNKYGIWFSRWKNAFKYREHFSKTRQNTRSHIVKNTKLKSILSIRGKPNRVQFITQPFSVPKKTKDRRKRRHPLSLNHIVQIYLHVW